jgi:hypothetical protein
MLGAWAVLGVVIVFRNELASEFAKAEAWRGLMYRALLGVSGIFALMGFVPAFSGLRRAPLESLVALALGFSWLGVMVWRMFFP